MKSLIKKFYTGRDVQTYEEKRSNNPKWMFEENVAKHYLNERTECEFSVLDSPVGTARFAKLYMAQSRVAKVIGLDYSDDMIKQAKSAGCSKLDVFKHDLVNDLVEIQTDVLFCYRFLNLLCTEEAQSALQNILPAIHSGGLISIRYIDPSYSGALTLDDKKIHLHQKAAILETIEGQGFHVQTEHVCEFDKKCGCYSIMEISRR